MNYRSGDCKGNLDAATRCALRPGRRNQWLDLGTYIYNMSYSLSNDPIVELQKNEPKQLRRLSCAQNRTPCAGVQLRPRSDASLRRSGRAAGHEADWSKRVNRLTTLIERGPFDLDDPLRF